ncbi:coiled-coil domain-containing protein-domain-containing protein [Boeremia exigua]|uniref:coiled-coil domain-containing protein-domain-containing protein n=1 Tax=Boeremia exigua TaxID=749465 RepID=UPI001E8E7340|nr:coiled-coil domain-containing protein-domain-containing protein [Boeremia exigua]KAH6644076.1 coiled-coil domain-containing protein-domain-containing protein [Boeremia exigua]
MAPQPLRPASAQDAADSSKILPMDADDAADADEVFARDQMRQKQEGKAQSLVAKNRRKRYLEVHPEYFDDSSLELVDPLLYDRLIRRFQTAREREAEGQRKGFSGQMSTDLWRAEAKKDALAHTDPKSLFVYTRGPQGQIMEEDKDDVPMTKEEGKTWWMDEMTQRFLSGADDDFDYKTVDANDKYDDEKERDIQDAYFDSMESDFDSDGEGKEKVLTGETGIQDY